VVVLVALVSLVVVGLIGAMDMFTSHRKLPSSILPSHVPKYLNNFCKVDTTDAASYAECICGRKTISIRVEPARLKSI